MFTILKIGQELVKKNPENALLFEKFLFLSVDIQKYP